MRIASLIGIQRALAFSLMGLALLYSSDLAAQASTVAFDVSGTSTVRGWTCSVDGTAEVTAGGSASVSGFSDGVQAATLSVQVEEFSCPQDQMREHLLEAMRANEFPRITFTLDSYEASGQGAVANGSLTILDATRDVSFPISLTPSGGGVAIAGELPLDVTDYGVEPPVVMLGLMRVRPEIRIQFSGMVAS